MKKYELRKPEAVYFINDVNWWHFGFDCACGEKNVIFGSNEESFVKLLEKYPRLWRRGHSFYFRLDNLREEFQMRFEHKEKDLVILCKGCDNKFVFNKEIFKKLEREICQEENLVIED